MARIRTIKPDFFTSLTVADLAYEARLTFIGLWTHVDDQGRCVDDSRLVKAAVWPLDERTAKDVDADLWELADAGLIQRYTVERKKFIAVRSWEEHQRINRPSAAKLPPPEEGEATPKAPTGLTESSVKAHGGLSEGSSGPHAGPFEGSSNPHAEPEMSESVERADGGGPGDSEAVVLAMFTCENEAKEEAHGGLSEDSLTAHGRKGKERKGTGKGKETTSPRSARTSDDALEAEFQEWYGGYPLKKEPGNARKAYAKARTKATAQELLAGRDRYVALDAQHARGFTKYPATWLNKECWLDEYDSQPPRQAVGDYQPYRNPTDPNAYTEEW